MTVRVYLSLGSNQGDCRTNLARGVESLRQEGVQVGACSSLYETEPVGVEGQPDFLNMACCAETALDPVSLLLACQRIEREMNGVSDKHLKPRKLDIDILFYGRRIVETPELRIPHPAWDRRGFVLVPLEEIAPDWLDPVTGRRVADVRRDCTDTSRVLPVRMPNPLEER